MLANWLCILQNKQNKKRGGGEGGDTCIWQYHSALELIWETEINKKNKSGMRAKRWMKELRTVLLNICVNTLTEYRFVHMDSLAVRDRSGSYMIKEHV